MGEWTYRLTFASSSKPTKIILKLFKKDINLKGQRNQKRWQQHNFGKWKTDVQVITDLANAKRQIPNSSNKSDF